MLNFKMTKSDTFKYTYDSEKHLIFLEGDKHFNEKMLIKTIILKNILL